MVASAHNYSRNGGASARECPPEVGYAFGVSEGAQKIEAAVYDLVRKLRGQRPHPLKFPPPTNIDVTALNLLAISSITRTLGLLSELVPMVDRKLDGE